MRAASLGGGGEGRVTVTTCPADSVNSTAAWPGLAMGKHSRLASVDQPLRVPQQLVGYNLKIKQIPNHAY